MLNEDNESHKKKHFKNLRKTIQRLSAIRKNDQFINLRGSNPINSNSYILSILEMNYKDSNSKRICNIRKSSKL